MPSTNFIQEKIGKLSVVYTHFYQEAMYRPPTAICWFGQATINLINHPNSGQTGLVSFNELPKYCREFSYQYNGLLSCRACVRSEAYTVLFARKEK